MPAAEAAEANDDGTWNEGNESRTSHRRTYAPFKPVYVRLLDSRVVSVLQGLFQGIFRGAQFQKFVYDVMH